MSLVILQPAANVDAQKHYVDTVETPVPFDRLAKSLSNDEMKLLESIYDSEHALVWGVVPGVNGANVKKWNRVTRGDIVLFCRNRQVVSSATVSIKIHSRKLAQDLWGEDPHGATWEYVYFLDELCSQSIPYEALNAAAGYEPNNNVQGFNVLDESKSRSILAILGLESDTIFPAYSREDYLNALQKLADTPLDIARQTSARTEQAFLRNALFGTRRTGTCCICGESFPVEFLVASHIKKRCQCSDEEKRDYLNIVAPMCKFGCDELYEKGYIGVQNGEVVVLKPQPSSTAIYRNMQKIQGRQCPSWKDGTKAYFEWHCRKHGV